MPIDTAVLCAELSAVNAGAAALCEGLDEDQLAWRPHPGKWSIAENLIHLRTTTAVFLPAVDRALQQTLHRDLRSTGPFRLSWYGRLLVRYVEPPPVIRLPAPKALRPLPGSPACALESFLRSQAAMMQRIETANGLDLAALRFPSPLASYVRMNLLEFFSVFNGHARRHLWQANNVPRELPAAERV
ncbi:MAG: DinB family protein [Acidobacteriaceae bacterium]